MNAQQHDDGGDQPKKRGSRKTKSSKMQRQMDEEEGEQGSEAGDQSENVEEEECFDENGALIPCKKKHIHPCVCDLSKRQKQKISAFLKEKTTNQIRFDQRVREIEDELERLEEERLQKERELQEQQELFGDEYEVVGKKKRRKKRSARRASMVSLGVKQVINWKKPPKHPVKHTHASNLKKEFTSYCGKSECPLSPPVPIDYRKEPSISIRATHTFELRSGVNFKLREYLIKSEDKRVPFVTPYYV